MSQTEKKNDCCPHCGEKLLLTTTVIRGGTCKGKMFELLNGTPQRDQLTAAELHPQLLESVRKGDVRNFLVENPEVDPGANDNEALLLAIQIAQSESALVLLDDRRVDPAANDNIALRRAIELRRTSVIERLLKDGRVKTNFSKVSFRAGLNSLWWER